MNPLPILALVQAVYGGHFDPDARYVQCRYANGERALLLRGSPPDKKTLVIIASNGSVIDPSTLKFRDGALADIETNGGVASRAAIEALYEELSRLRPSAGNRTPYCRHPQKDGMR
ncbi:hypothetical protein FHS95_001514 [Sphingomonas naasensis]|uniref:Uncharacterized protein n=1 Tax=Sphingomonas naasensis TaxID=1344951 RepID=A0A4S1WDA2_9SPHN|nr:hypothetical protein [Sphingomonas naasensis]NIJ19845.1 hypothetical protein [Sphingomonas naasensis]TGX40025.1 hypothetical protein E5A74_15740 [Sphingomonas naasensis]